jgi:hypothetical protein
VLWLRRFIHLGRCEVMKEGEHLAGAGQDANLAQSSPIGLAMQMSQLAGIVTAHRPFRLAEQRMGDQAPAHADPAVDALDRDLHPGVIECFLPGEDMLLNAVEERAIQVEHKDLLSRHRNLLPRTAHPWPAHSPGLPHPGSGPRGFRSGNEEMVRRLSPMELSAAC